MRKIKIHYVSGPIGDPTKEEKWGGTAATNYIIARSLEASDKYELVIRPRFTFLSMEEVKLFLDAGDIGWLDETSIANKYYLKGYDRPDVIGPICRSPVKRYQQGAWIADYTPEWFYSGVVLRLNEAEEKPEARLDTYKEHKAYKDINWEDKITFIRHAIDLTLLTPDYNSNKRYVLWAGNQGRDAKNFLMFKKIMEKVDKCGGLNGYEFKVLSDYNIKDYFDILDETALLINTSKYESFCCAVAEAMAKGVPTLVRKDFNGKYMFKDRPLQVEYEVNSYVNKIMELLDDESGLKAQSLIARQYAENNFSFDSMREDLERVFDNVIKEKNKVN